MMLNAYIQFKSMQITKDNIVFEPVIVFFILPTDQKKSPAFYGHGSSYVLLI